MDLLDAVPAITSGEGKARINATVLPDGDTIVLSMSRHALGALLYVVQVSYVSDTVLTAEVAKAVDDLAGRLPVAVPEPYDYCPECEGRGVNCLAHRDDAVGRAARM